MPRSKHTSNNLLGGGGSRKSSGGMFGGRSKPSSSKPSQAKAHPSAPSAPHMQAPQPHVVMGQPSLMSGLLFGVGMGAGSEVGHSAVRAVTGSSNKEGAVTNEETKTAATPVQPEYHPCASITASFLNVKLIAD